MKRIQRKRTKGWRMPENAKYVGRPTKFGNPYHPTEYEDRMTDEMQWVILSPDTDMEISPPFTDWDEAVKYSVSLYRNDIELMLRCEPDFLNELHGKDLACWCNLGNPCHADVLIKLCEALE